MKPPVKLHKFKYIITFKDTKVKIEGYFFCSEPSEHLKQEYINYWNGVGAVCVFK